MEKAPELDPNLENESSKKPKPKAESERDFVVDEGDVALKMAESDVEVTAPEDIMPKLEDEEDIEMRTTSTLDQEKPEKEQVKPKKKSLFSRIFNWPNN